MKILFSLLGRRILLPMSAVDFTNSSLRITIRNMATATPTPDSASSTKKKLRDPNTLSNYDCWSTKHTTAAFAIDFKAQRLTGDVLLALESLTSSESEQVILDTSYLDIKDVIVNDTKLEASKWTVKDRTGPYGSPLHITVPSTKQGDSLAIKIILDTTDKCTALQWLTPAQTRGPHPYMFSQCEAIHARSLFPCQDTPDVKSTYTFLIRSSLPVVASGIQKFTPDRDGDVDGLSHYTYEQAIPMPSYLFALASGDIHSADIGPRSRVLCTSDGLSDAKWELEEDTEKFIEVAEKLITPYVWGQYNVLILPPSFPFGGMENPIFTFATPTIISGDRQNVDVVAHELSHSWSGNLVSNGSWEHFWLNEGWTTYLERRIGMAIHGDEFRDFSSIIGWKALEDSVEQYGADHEFTKLVINLKGEDPDDAFSSIPYEKGFHFLYFLERTITKEAFDTFIPHYFTTWSKKSLDSYDFKATLLDFFKNDETVSKKLNEVDWDTWFYKPGLPPKPDFDTSLVDKCYALADKWASAGEDFNPSPSDITSWSGNQIVVFLESLQSLPKPLSPHLSSLLGTTYNLTASSTKNIELLSRYYGVGLDAKDESVYEPTAELLGQVGRMKFVRPLFRKLEKCDRELAVKTFEANREFYHPICRGMVEKDLGLV